MESFLKLLATRILQDRASPVVPHELGGVAKEIANHLANLPAEEAAQVLTSLNAQVAKEYSEAHAALRSDPVPPEILAEAERSFNEAEILEIIKEIRTDGGLRLEDFLPELEKAAKQSS